jgi:hypothetical protein
MGARNLQLDGRFSLACSPIFTSRRNCVSETGGLFAISETPPPLLVSRRFRPGVDQRDEVLHAIERAQTKEQAHAAAHSFLRWLEELEVLE